MKILKKIRPNVFVAWFAAFVLAVSWIAGAKCITASADDTPPAEITYIETEVTDIEFVKHPTCVFFGFRLSESDYDDFGEFQGDFGGEAPYATYEKYIALWLTYWKDFSQMNSEGARFDQLYAYWNGSAVGPWFENTVTHRSTLVLLEYGFVISIPAGTTFPSATYVHGGCEGTPIMYQTKTDCAFYYNGTDFVPLAYSVAQERIAATATLNAVNLNEYHDAERAEVSALVAAAKADIKICLTSFAIQERLETFEADLQKIMTKADYNRLDQHKTAKKAELNTYFADLETQSRALYDDESWQQIVTLYTEGLAIIDSVSTFDGVDNAVAGVKFAVANVPTIEEKANFAEYRDAAVDKVGKDFNEALYRDAERAQGLALIEAGKEAVENAKTSTEVDAIVAEYNARLAALKTDAQLTAEEKAAAEQEKTEEDSSSTGDNVVIIPGAPAEEDSGCGSVIGGIGITLGVTMMAASVIIKKKAGKKDEE